MSKDNVIWTDNENTRSLLWEAYNGFVEHYNNYMMYNSINRDNPVVMAGLIRYASFFYEEARIFFNKIKIPNDDVVRAKNIFENNSISQEDLYFLRRFFNDFLFHSGIKNVLITKDNRSGVEKTADRYQLNNKNGQ